jgi:hypothetical protein
VCLLCPAPFIILLVGVDDSQRLFAMQQWPQQPSTFQLAPSGAANVIGASPGLTISIATSSRMCDTTNLYARGVDAPLFAWTSYSVIKRVFMA